MVFRAVDCITAEHSVRGIPVSAAAEIALERDIVLRRPVREPAGSLRDLIGLEEASGDIGMAGTMMTQTLDLHLLFDGLSHAALIVSSAGTIEYDAAHCVVRMRPVHPFEANGDRAELASLIRTPGWPVRCLAAQGEGSAVPADGARRILIVEDDYFVGLQNEDLLAKAGFAVVGIATNAEYALSLAAQEQPDLVLMDIRLAQGDDGIDAATELLQRHALRCVFVTAHAGPAMRSRGVAARPLGWLVKPFTAGALLKCVRDALAAKQREDGD